MAYTITLSPSGKTFTCAGTGEVLKAGLAAGLFMPYSCRSGVCRTCRGRVVAGEIDFGAVHPKYLPAEDRAQGYALLCQARPLSDLTIEVDEIGAGEGIRPKYMPARILRMRKLASDVMQISIGLPMNEPMIFRAGQYVELCRPDGARRNYSIASTPSNDGVRQIEIHVRHMPGGVFTDYVFNAMREGEVHKIQVPLGSFFLREDSDKPMVLLASGTGFAPIRAIVNDSLRRGIRRPIHLYWGGRRREDLYMQQECEMWAGKNPQLRFIPVLSEPSPRCRWEGRTGFVHRAVLDDFGDLSGHQVYACGSPVVIDAARESFAAQRGLPPSEFFADSFITGKEMAAEAVTAGV